MGKSCPRTSKHVSFTDHTHYLFLNSLRIWVRKRHHCNRSILTLLYWTSHAMYTHSFHFRSFQFRFHEADSLFPNNVSSTALQELIRLQQKGESRPFTKHITAEVTSKTRIRQVKIRQSLYKVGQKYIVYSIGMIVLLIF